jgi:hypothetical protein
MGKYWLNKRINPLIEPQAKIRVALEAQHDKNIFVKLSQILPEDDFRSIIFELQTNLRYLSGDTSRIQRYYETIFKTENHFLDTDTESEAITLAKCLELLHHFIMKSFFIFPDNKIDDRYQYCLYPNHDTERNSDDFSDENQQFFWRETDKLIDLTNQALLQFDKFRKIIKKKLII